MRSAIPNFLKIAKRNRRYEMRTEKFVGILAQDPNYADMIRDEAVKTYKRPTADQERTTKSKGTNGSISRNALARKGVQQPVVHAQ